MSEPCGCFCHTGPYAACDIPGGCGSISCGRNDTTTCRNDTGCKAYDRTAGHASPTSKPLCDACLDHAEPVVRGLVYDYLDLAQLHQASMSQAINEKTSGGGHESPILLSGHVEALQAEIVHVTTTWEHALRAFYQLHNPGTYTPLWRITVYDHINLTNQARAVRGARAGALIQRAISVIGPRLHQLAALPVVTVCPAGIEDEPGLMHGWEAIGHLQDLHQRARSTLGRTTRSFFIPGDCWHCGARPVDGVDGPLGRTEPRFEGDPMQVHCTRCTAVRPYADYEHMQQHLMWPDHATDSSVRVAA